MYRNYFKIAWRNVIKNKVYSTINIMGLAIGMTVTLLIALWVQKEYSYNRFLRGYENVYQVKLNHTIEGEIHTIPPASLPLADALRNSIPEIKYVAETDAVKILALFCGINACIIIYLISDYELASMRFT